MKLLRVKSILSIVLVIAVGMTAIPAVSAQEDSSGPRGYLGIRYEAAENGILVIDVEADGPADTAGIQANDVITEINGEAVDAETVRDVVSGFAPEDVITVSVLRGDETLSLEITLGEQPAEMAAVIPEFVIPNDGRGNFRAQPFLGVRLNDTDNGVEIVEVVEGSPAAEIGLMAGDVLTQVNGADVASAQEAVEMVRALEPGAQIDLTVTRGEETLEFSVVLRPITQPRIRVLPGGRDGRLPIIPRFGNGGFVFTPGELTYSPEESAWTVGAIAEDSVLYEAGLREGDKITAVNGQVVEIDNLRDLRLELGNLENVTLTVQRGEETLELETGREVLPLLLASIVLDGSILPDLDNFEFEILPPNMIPDPRGMTPFMMPQGARLGVSFIMLDAQVAEEYGVSQTEGALITDVTPRSPADRAGLQLNDVVKSVDGEALNVETTLRDIIAAKQPGDVITLEVVRGEETLSIEVTLGQPEQFSGLFPPAYVDPALEAELFGLEDPGTF